MSTVSRNPNDFDRQDLLDEEATAQAVDGNDKFVQLLRRYHPERDANPLMDYMAEKPVQKRVWPKELT